MNSRFKSST